MSKFTSFDEKDFWKAIEEKDYTSLKINTVSSMLNDPTFDREETDTILKILEKEVPGIFEEEVELDYEERLEPSEWDKRYFTKLTYWFQENFAKSRIDYIKEVGKVVHRDTAQKYNDSINRRPAQLASKPVGSRQGGGSTANPTKAPEAKEKALSLPGVIAAAATLVLVVVLLVKLLK